LLHVAVSCLSDWIVRLASRASNASPHSASQWQTPGKTGHAEDGEIKKKSVYNRLEAKQPEPFRNSQMKSDVEKKLFITEENFRSERYKKGEKFNFFGETVD